MKTSNHFARPIAPPPCECDHTAPVLADRVVGVVLVLVAVGLGALLIFAPATFASVECVGPPIDRMCTPK